MRLERCVWSSDGLDEVEFRGIEIQLEIQVQGEVTEDKFGCRMMYDLPTN